MPKRPKPKVPLILQGVKGTSSTGAVPWGARRASSAPVQRGKPQATSAKSGRRGS